MPRNGKSEDRTGAREVTVCRSNDDKTPQRPKKTLKRPKKCYNVDSIQPDRSNDVQEQEGGCCRSIFVTAAHLHLRIKLGPLSLTHRDRSYVVGACNLYGQSAAAMASLVGSNRRKKWKMIDCYLNTKAKLNVKIKLFFINWNIFVLKVDLLLFVPLLRLKLRRYTPHRVCTLDDFWKKFYKTNRTATTMTTTTMTTTTLPPLSGRARSVKGGAATSRVWWHRTRTVKLFWSTQFAAFWY